MGFNPIETLARARRLRGKAQKNRIDSGFAKAQVTGEGEAEKRLCHALCGQREGGRRLAASPLACAQHGKHRRQKLIISA